MRTVLTYGSFDLFHYGHVNLLCRARKLGDRLIVGLSSDEFNGSKGKVTVVPYRYRLAVIESCRFVDEVIKEESWSQKEDDIRRFGVTDFVMGGDWAGKFDFLSPLCRVHYLPRTEGVSTSEIKNTLALIQQMAREFSG